MTTNDTPFNLGFRNRSPLTLGLLAGLSLGAAAGGCGLIDIPITLQTQEYTQNFGNTTGTVQSVSCTMDSQCSTVATQAAAGIMIPNATSTGFCETTSPQTCSARINATVSYTVDLSKDQSFVTQVGGKAVAIVKSISLGYGVPTNSLNFAIPELDLYIAPQGVTSVTDSRAVALDKIPAIAAGTTSADSANSITIDTSSPAGQLFVRSIQNPSQTFVLLANTKPVIKGGQAVPKGQITLRITPKIVVGF